MSQFYNLTQIKEVLKNLQPIQDIEEGFVAYSKGKTVIPPVGEMIFEKPPGDVHIKYGYILDDDYYVIKIASGFIENPELNRYNSDGLLLLFKKGSGKLVCGLMDECHLTNVRTAAAGAVAARYLAPKNINCIGIVGAGAQGRMQLEFLKSIIDCRNVLVWGLNQKELDEYQEYMKPGGYNIKTTLRTEDIADNCNFIVTATPSKTPLLPAELIRKGTHITAMGSDTPEKRELDPQILEKADIVVGDSISQCLLRGEIHQALKAGLLKKEKIVELGKVIADPKLQRTSEEQTTIADLTGVAVQDLQIAKAVYHALKDKEKNQTI